MTITTAPIRNGVDTAQVYGTLDALKSQPELARFVFRATNRWIDGPHSPSTIQGFAKRVVDRALELSGGAGYLNGSPLARAYRDVRAGAFMHPLGADRAYDFLGSVALGRQHDLH